MPIYDVTVPLSNELPTYPGDPGIEIRDWLSLANGDAANVSVLNFGEAAAIATLLVLLVLLLNLVQFLLQRGR